MRLRFIKVLALVVLLAGAYVGVARALDFNDEDTPPAGEVGAAYSFKLGVHGGCIPYHFHVDSGSLPPGLKLTDFDYYSGLISGTPTEAGTYTAWLSVIDCDNKTSQDLFEFNIAPRKWGITTASLPKAVAGSPYTTTLQAGGQATTTVTWRVTSGLLPAGLILGTDGTISGTPTSAGSSTFTITATSTDASGTTRTDARQLTLNVISLTVSLSRQVGEVGVRFSSALAVSGGTAPYTWSANGGLPAGISIAPNGTVTGVPAQAGSFTLTAHVVDSSGVGSDVRLPFVVRPHVAIAGRLQAASVGHAYQAKLSARGGVAPLRWSIAQGTLPRGLKLAANGTLRGTANTSGTFRIRIRVRDALGAVATKTFVLAVH